MLSGKRILLVIGGGIAAFKALDLIRRLRERGATVTGLITAGGQQFVTPLSVAALCEQPVYTELFDLKNETEIGHIQLSRQADLIVVCPATADLIARMANGQADDLASTVLLATDKRVLVAPAMNVRMWLHPATQRNVAQLRADGALVMAPDEGPMACGEFGPGRLPTTEAILAAIVAAFGPASRPLAGKHVLVTAGPTREPIDPVRFLSNHSSGKQGYAIAGALAALGARVTLVSGPTALAPPPGVDRVDVETALEMEAACNAALPCDVAVCVAAVADWRVAAAGQKLKKQDGEMPSLTLIENPDILAGLAQRQTGRPQLVIGFAAETHEVLDYAVAKRARKGCDWIVANDVTGEAMGGARNQVHLVTATGVESWPELPKADVAARLALRIAENLTGSPNP
ncbi:bifunctional phosphopantothenoylcysteine decarboxylase/phosphopantothenate--cysteine ligase CoaBC [Hankyongella ginsenosidimutans]|uniref:Coenzyme A biosynthesis bifunctional protein CoaBC n=1 Tax=Hankyongella ginsenosidimutans TaxID=1763828 RepID=A0A4D7CB64_9SPHN|nr:bifunctional phosphopantothenoylcysteine decarboxylase/phosphopantothenate--cysteine ligase CoaBC [Hankyongella ginsenosidimutans]QCI79026.1 bifunctional phosphopantothenoylcysteine decarboxylase/phosphopantothenate--cysteine ligase CoaBC [Hankyongella ginsenosidimutans]TXG82559.1 MAG: bifunctional phosphopantothenoylcysteine decarboxylase/phosphopantothenate--cysteine ligase CoaBC [Sphingomonadales bacterium]